MLFKSFNGQVVCVKYDSGDVQYNPQYQIIVHDETVPWVSSDRSFVRLADYSFVYADDPRLLDNAKQLELDALRASFDERVAGSFTTSHGYLMQFDTTDAIKMEGAIKLLEATGAAEGYLTQADDATVYNVPIDEMKTVLIEMMTAYAACHARKQELRAQINAAQTKEDLDAIEITWPV